MFTRLDWDSEFFGFSVARVSESADPRETAEALKKEGYSCAYLLLNPNAFEIERAEQAGFRMADVRVEYGWSGTQTEPNAIGVIESSPALEDLARSAFTDSRFFVDSRFPRDKVEDMFALWVQKSARILGIPDQAFVTVDAKEGYSQIGLIAVEPALRGKGIAKQLVQATQATDSEIRVVTQGRNRAACRLYESAGFSVRETKLWYHWWGDR